MGFIREVIRCSKLRDRISNEDIRKKLQIFTPNNRLNIPNDVGKTLRNNDKLDLKMDETG